MPPQLAGQIPVCAEHQHVRHLTPHEPVVVAFLTSRLAESELVACRRSELGQFIAPLGSSPVHGASPTSLTDLDALAVELPARLPPRDQTLVPLEFGSRDPAVAPLGS